MTDPPTPRRRIPTAVKVLGGLAVVAIVAVVVGVVVFLADDPPPPLSVQDITGGTGVTTGSGPTTLDGSWQVVPGGPSQAGLRIKEQFVGGLAEHEAVGRTTDISGSIVVSSGAATSGSFTVGLRALTWSDTPGFPTENRTMAMKNMGLQTDQYPSALFELTSPVVLDGALGAEPVRLEAKGRLTLHGTTRDVTIPVEVARTGDQIALATAEPVTVALTDYGIPEPSTPAIAGVADTGSFEFAVVLAQA